MIFVTDLKSETVKNYHEVLITNKGRLRAIKIENLFTLLDDLISEINCNHESFSEDGREGKHALSHIRALGKGSKVCLMNLFYCSRVEENYGNLFLQYRLRTFP